MTTELREQCTVFFSGHRPHTPAEDFTAMAQWCAAHRIQHDVYGEGALVQDFEQQIAQRLGFPAALFVITGTLTRATTLRLVCRRKGRRLVAMHPSAHVVRHERSNWQLLDHFDLLQIGDPHRLLTLEDVEAVKDPLAAMLYELPMREIGGQLPTVEELDAIKALCRERDIHLHLDGARLWEAAAATGLAPAEFCRGADSAYVSFYKGVGGLGGAMLLGDTALVAEAAEWMKRMGGNVFRRSPYVVAAAMQFEQRLAMLPACFARTRWLYEVLSEFPLLQPNPAAPQVNMLHLHLPVSRERALAIRDQMARKNRVWLFGGAQSAMLPDHSVIECYVGENLLNLPDEEVRALLARFSALLAAD